MKQYKLGDIAEIVNGATPSTSVAEFYDGDVIWFTPKDLSDSKTKYVDKGDRNISKKGFDSCSTHLIPPYNILMSSRAPIGLLAINTTECCTNQGFKNLIVDKTKVDVDYLYYYLKYHIEEVEALGSGTTFKEVSRASLEQYQLTLPEFHEQKAIASVLSSLDRKIALNRVINRNLEAMAKQLYDYWFVQFDFPDEEGKPYKSSGGKMVWNETLKREIPKGWEVRPLGSVVTKYQQGLIRSNSQLSNEEKFAYLKMGDLDGHGGYTCENLARTNATDKEVSSYTLSFGDFLINVRNSKEIVGKTCLINYVEKDTLYNHMLVRLDFNNVSALYMKHVFNSSYMTKLIDGIKKGTTTVIALYQEDLYRLPVLVPSCAIMNMFDELTYGMQKNIALSNENSYSLKSIRKHILPLLMNGQVSVTQLNSDLSHG